MSSGGQSLTALIGGTSRSRSRDRRSIFFVGTSWPYRTRWLARIINRNLGALLIFRLPNESARETFLKYETGISSK